MILLDHRSTDAAKRRSKPEKEPQPNPPSTKPEDQHFERYFFVDEFTHEGAGEVLMAVMPGPSRSAKRNQPPKGLPAYLQHLWTLPVLTRVQEQHCFRKLNYLKYLLSKSTSRTDTCSEADGMLDDKQPLKESIQRTRNFLIESNLRLVISIAKRYAAPSTEHFDELVCSGNAALIRAVDLFDFRRGTRFSTYAYQAIERSLYAVYRREKRYRSKLITEGEERLEQCCSDAGESYRGELEANAAREQVKKLMAMLDERDQHIVKARFGMGRQQTRVAFHVIAKEVNLSTTRTIQLFKRSLQRMNQKALAICG